MQQFRATTLAILSASFFSAPHAWASGNAGAWLPVQREEPVLRTYALSVHLSPTPHAQTPAPGASQNTGARLFVLAPSADPVSTISPASREPAAERTTTPSGESLLWTLTRVSEPAVIAATIRASSSPVFFDDQAARSVPWPIRGWPEHTADFLRDLSTRDAEDPRVRDLVARWVGAQNRSVTPVMLAKYLAARTLTHAPATLEPLTLRDAQGRALGIRSGGAGRFAERSGSEFDMLRFYATALRAANIPARVVVGLRDTGDAGARQHAWVEFFLYDERVRRGDWVPVDLIAQRDLDPTPPALAKPWKHFGADREGALIPLGFGCPPQTRAEGVLAPWWVEADSPARTPVASVAVERRADDKLARAN
ncbi:MAG: transglutaminase domain-containing protein [Phycisphaeraceae bacterium]|nr:transglutaminase domain-containing protein [Phycisphaeraceae bacterium]